MENSSDLEKVIEVLKTCYDPEIPLNIYEMGLIYGVDVDSLGFVKITMTLTTPSCPVAQSMPMEIENKVSDIEGIKGVNVTVVWDPPWDYEKMTDAAKLQLGML